MEHDHLVDTLAPVLATLPNGTQLSVAFTEGDSTCFAGLIKNDYVEQIHNTHAAFEIGSVTKAFTGYLLALLATEGKVHLDTNIADFLNVPLKDSPVITLRQLALHTSGLPRLPHNFETQDNYNIHNPYNNYTEALLNNYLSRDLRLDSEPGTRHQYSNLGYGLLSYIIGRLEQRPFEQVVAERVFKPLGMTESTFDHTQVSSGMVQGLDEQGDAAPCWNGGLLNGCLGIISTAADLVKFAAHSMDGSNAAVHLQSTETFPIEPNVHSNLGWGVRMLLPDNIMMQGINGGTGGFGASILLNTERKAAISVLSNIWPHRYQDVIYPVAKGLLIN